VYPCPWIAEKGLYCPAGADPTEIRELRVQRWSGGLTLNTHTEGYGYPNLRRHTSILTSVKDVAILIGDTCRRADAPYFCSDFLTGLFLMLPSLGTET
jgi:hypothetical protein